MVRPSPPSWTTPALTPALRARRECGRFIGLGAHPAAHPHLKVMASTIITTAATRLTRLSSAPASHGHLSTHFRARLARLRHLARSLITPSLVATLRVEPAADQHFGSRLRLLWMQECLPATAPTSCH